MDNQDWTNLQWKKLNKSQKIWLIILFALFGLLLVGAIISAMGIVEIPTWVAIVWVVFGIFAVIKNVIGLKMYHS